MSQFSQCRVLGAASVFALSLSGCMFNGNYPDATGDDAAKLRFISSNDNTVMALFDAEHCDGRSTGMLNNIFSANANRRADMRVAPPAGAKAYVEVRLQPGVDYFAQANTNGTGYVCTLRFNLVPQKHGEYEVSFDSSRKGCELTLNVLTEQNGKALRTPLPMVERGLPSCAGANPIFPKIEPMAPQSPERSALIERIIDASIIDKMKPELNRPLQSLQTSIDTTVQTRKARMGIDLPAAYWSEYRSNIERFLADTQQAKVDVLQGYKDYYRRQLAPMDTADLERLLPDNPKADRSVSASNNSNMLEFYNRSEQQVLRENYSAHQARMADLDRRFDVCARFAGCWRN
ncbi:hypothetical protein [Pseudomonas cremoricolorata]|uniref:hypothetical protein n=1 Tax=Pseudomonas cremoricolorata TaxID=157783 RepID=UPI000400BEAA|nr:hypothetical protein [Pseudomonas cremoricolorata]